MAEAGVPQCRRSVDGEAMMGSGAGAKRVEFTGGVHIGENRIEE
jgi:hypothetical protein